MKTLNLTILLALASGGFLGAQSQPAMRDAITHDQLVQKLRRTAQEDPMRRMEPSTGSDPAKANRPGNLLANSDILCFSGRATLVPKRAILHLPPTFAERLKFQQGAKLQNWAEFLIENRGWISTVEVTRPQAEGNQPMAEDLTKRIAESDKLVVATYQGGPISVLPPKAPATDPAAAPTTNPAASPATNPAGNPAGNPATPPAATATAATQTNSNRPNQP